MKAYLVLFLGLLSFVGMSTPSRADTLANDVIGNLYLMRTVYSAEYAPAAWKKAYANYDLDVEFNKAVAAVQANPNLTLKDSREILKNFVYAMKDYHTSIKFSGTEAASLPFSVKGTDNRFFIMYIDRTKLPESSFPFHVGDELVTFDGKTTAAAVADVQSQIPANVPTTDKALAEIYLTKRSVFSGYTVPQGPVTIGVKPQTSGVASPSVVNYQMVWDYIPESVLPRGTLTSSLPSLLTRPGRPTADLMEAQDRDATAAPIKLFRPQMNFGVDTAPSANPYDLGGRKTFTPDLGMKIWESADSDFFYAYIYKGSDNKLGSYIRIASYEAGDYGKAVGEFARDMALFESASDSLVIDETNNPGGSVFYLYALASMLTTQPLYTPLHRMSIAQADVSQALTQISQLSGVKTDDDAKALFKPTDADGYPITYEFAQMSLNYARFIVNEWNAGRKLTSPYFIGGVDHINAAETHYSKPILLLINHLDFSGGDFFPTIMQDNKRVTIFGSRTAGAGGYVNDVIVLNNIGIDKFRCTQSIAERVDLNPIENLGVSPDIHYEMTADDFSQNYSGYTKAIQAEVGSLTK